MFRIKKSAFHAATVKMNGTINFTLSDNPALLTGII